MNTLSLITLEYLEESDHFILVSLLSQLQSLTHNNVSHVRSHTYTLTYTISQVTYLHIRHRYVSSTVISLASLRYMIPST
jgi:hypothetical protein